MTEPTQATGTVAQKAPRTSRHSILVGVAMLFIALLAWGGTEVYAHLQPSTSVLVTDSDGRKYSFPLSTDASHEITTSMGTNIIEIEDGSVHVEQASCPNLLCVHQGAISRAGQTIVCLPNELVVTIEGSPGDDPNRPEVDTVAK